MSEITGVSGDSSHSREWITKTHKSSRHRKARPTEVDNHELATQFHKACLRVFKLFLHYLPVLSTFRINADQTANAKEELGRLYLWGESFGNGGLEKALEQSDEIRDNVLKLLRGIGGTLLRGLSKFRISVTQENPFRQDVQYLDAFIDQSKSIIDKDTHEMDDEHEDASSESDEDEESPEELGSRLINDLKIRIQCLMDLVPTLGLNLALAEKVRQRELLGITKLSAISEPAHVYISLVREKYKEADDRLVERLGKANWQRHVAIRRKLDETSASPEPDPRFIAEKDVVPSALGPSTFYDSGIGARISGQAFPQARISPGAFHTSSISSNAKDDLKAARVPRMPAENGIGKPFCCDYCGNILKNIKNRQDWKRHVFADLRPYICTVAGCRDELAQFTSRELWGEHEFNEHRVEESWVCPHCHLESSSPGNLEQHVHKLHGIVFISGSKLRIALGTAHKRRERPAEHEQCFLCKTFPGLSRRAFIKHVAQHMEEIALMSLPRETEDDSEDVSVTDIEGSDHPPDLRDDRPHKCPVVACSYHQKGFTRMYDRKRHTLTHYKGTMICHFCPGFGSAAERSFNRVEVFKRHLTSVHGAKSDGKRNRPNAAPAKEIATQSAGRCSTCTATFHSAQDFYKHLDDCVVRTVCQEEPSNAINERNLSGVSNDLAFRDALDIKMLPLQLKPMARSLHNKPSLGTLKCNLCNENPDGFLSELELRRHIERNHSIVRKFWQCVDISSDKKFLAECPACTSGKKYNSYYNAAAHLRRAHFNPSNGNPGKAGDRRGIDADTVPSMEVLKTWMKEVEGSVPQWNKTAKEFDPLVIESYSARAVDKLSQSTSPIL